MRDYLARHPNEPAHFTQIAKAIGLDSEQEFGMLNSYLANRARGLSINGPLRNDPVLTDVVRVRRGIYAYQPGASRAPKPVVTNDLKPVCVIERGDLLEVGHISQNGVLVLLGSNGCTYVGTIREVEV